MRKLSLGDSLRIRREGTADSRVDLIHDSSAIIPWRNRPIRNIILCGLLLIAMIAVGTSIMVTNFRNRELADNERELKNVALIVAEQTDRSFQSLELVLTSVIERMQSLGIASSEDFERQMSSQDVQLMLKDKISALPHIEAVTLINADGKIINFSRFWPTPDINIANRKHFIAFKSDPQLISFISEPVLNRSTGTWSVFLMRKFTAPNGEFVGLVHGAVDLTYFEKFFASILLGEQSSVALYRGDGVLLARYPRVNSAIGKTFIQAVKAIGDDDGGTVRYIGAMEGKDRILAAHRVAHYPLHISIARDTDAVLASWRTETRSLLGAGGLGVLAITGMIVLIVRQDSQAHKRSKKRLALEKQRLSTAVNNMTQGLLMFDADEKIAIVNQRYIEMYGVSPDVVKPGCSFRELINHRREAGAFFGDIDQYCGRIIAKITAKKTTNRVMEGADGRTISIVSRPLSDGGWVATYEDITEARRREESFRLLFESNPVAMLVIDRASMRFLAVNDAAITHYGYSREQFMSMMATDLRPAEDRESADQYLKTISADEISGNNARHVKADGTRIDVCMYSRILTYEGQSARLSAVHDVTDRERALDELSRTQAFLDAIVENMPTPIIVKDVRGHRYTLVNRATEACFGIPRGE
jgi:PAS domain S-box-containing protein